MVAYCSATEVAYLVHTDLDDTAIGILITLADAELDQMLGGSTLATNLLKLCSMMLTAILVAQRDPEATTLGSARIQYGSRVEDWRGRVWAIVKRNKAPVIKSSSYRKIDEDTRYPE